MKPSDFIQLNKTVKQKHLEYATKKLNELFGIARIKSKPFIKPYYEKCIKLKNSKIMVWRFKWIITEEFILSTHYSFGMIKPIRNDCKHNRHYVLDVYEDHSLIDYIIEKE